MSPGISPAVPRLRRRFLPANLAPPFVASFRGFSWRFFTSTPATPLLLLDREVVTGRFVFQVFLYILEGVEEVVGKVGHAPRPWDRKGEHAPATSRRSLLRVVSWRTRLPPGFQASLGSVRLTVFGLACGSFILSLCWLSH